jgi:hypothetical protein
LSSPSGLLLVPQCTNACRLKCGFLCHLESNYQHLQLFCEEQLTFDCPWTFLVVLPQIFNTSNVGV